MKRCYSFVSTNNLLCFFLILSQLNNALHKIHIYPLQLMIFYLKLLNLFLKILLSRTLQLRSTNSCRFHRSTNDILLKSIICNRWRTQVSCKVMSTWLYSILICLHQWTFYLCICHVNSFYLFRRLSNGLGIIDRNGKFFLLSFLWLFTIFSESLKLFLFLDFYSLFFSLIVEILFFLKHNIIRSKFIPHILFNLIILYPSLMLFFDLWLFSWFSQRIRILYFFHCLIILLLID